REEDCAPTPMPGPESRAWHQYIVVCGRKLIPVVVGLERPLRTDADIGRLVGRKLRQLCAKLGQMQSRYFFIQVLWKNINAVFVQLRPGPQLDLRQNLVCKGGRHDKARMSCRVAEVEQPPLRKKDHA